MTTTYPIAPGSLAADEARFLLSEPGLIGQRMMKAMGEDMFPISTNLLQGRASLEGGSAVVWPVAAPTAAKGVRTVAAGGEYPEVELFTDKPETIKSLKQGYKAKITDEALSRDRFGVTAALNDAMTFLGNGMTVNFEELCAAAIKKATIPAHTGVSWVTGGAKQLAKDVIRAYNTVIQLKKGFTPSKIVVTLEQWAEISVMLVDVTGNANGPLKVTGLNPWEPSSWFVCTDLSEGWQPTLVDSRFFGGIAHETIDSEGRYTQVGAPGGGFEVQTFRASNGADTRYIQCRKTDVPYIWNKDAAITITDTGL